MGGVKPPVPHRPSWPAQEQLVQYRWYRVQLVSAVQFAVAQEDL